ncbi:MAG: L-rhamnose mutarotase, partial [Sphingobacteriales bacterium]
MRKGMLALLLTSMLFSACADRPAKNDVKRFGSVTGLKPEKLGYYKQLHANAWPEVLNKIKECNIRNYSIYLQKIKNEYYLFSYFEYVG